MSSVHLRINTQDSPKLHGIATPMIEGTKLTVISLEKRGRDQRTTERGGFSPTYFNWGTGEIDASNGEVCSTSAVRTKYSRIKVPMGGKKAQAVPFIVDRSSEKQQGEFLVIHNFKIG